MPIINGIDTDALPDQFENAVPGRTLILDGDGPCYVAAATAKRLDTALRNFKQEVLKRMFMCNAQDARVHLTSRDSDKHGRFRVKAVKPYQGQRNGPKPALLEPLREAVADENNWLPEYVAFLHRDKEADDYMIQDAYVYKEDGVISSEDKDLRMTPYPYYELDRGQVMASCPVGHVTLKFTPAGTPKLAGQGPMFFWGQMLCGDSADNIKGILKYDGALCGPAGAFKVLENAKDIDTAANLVLDGYRAIDQNPVAEGWLLWLTRWRGDNVIEYMNSLALSPSNKDFVRDCTLRDWASPKPAKEFEDVPF